MNSPLNKVNSFKTALIVLTVLTPGFSYAADYEARLNWSQRTGLGTPVSGVVEKVFVVTGDKVKKGEKLVQLDASVFSAHVREYKAKLKSAEEHYREAERERDRAIELYDRTVLSDHDLQMAKNNLTTAKAQMEKVRAMLKASQFDLKYSTVRAPFDILVLSTTAQPGQVIATEFKQEPLVIVVAANKMLARFYAKEEQLGVLTKGREATVTVVGRKYTGTIKAIGLEVETSQKGTTGYPVDVEFNVNGVILRSGQTAKVGIN